MIPVSYTHLMGGANGGNIASEIAVKKISDRILTSYRADQSEEDLKYLITSSVTQANTAVYVEAQRNEELHGMGTTVVVAIIRNDIIHILHAGDSRAYLIAADGVWQLTTDHSMVQELVNNGDITEVEAKHHPCLLYTSATACCHEIDHLNGILFKSHVIRMLDPDELEKK